MDLTIAADGILGQLDGLLNQLKPEDYKRPSQLLNKSSIGQHVRHSLEFFLCLKEGTAHGTVNYDKRKRDKVIEEDIEFARIVLRGIADWIKNNSQNAPLKLETNFSRKENSPVIIPSSYHRELTYNIEHTVHHMALIRVAINEFCSYMSLPEEFGVASSTIRNMQQSNKVKC